MYFHNFHYFDKCHDNHIKVTVFCCFAFELTLTLIIFYIIIFNVLSYLGACGSVCCIPQPM